MRILFAEDDPSLRMFVSRGLAEAGHAVDSFSTGSDAWDAFRTVEYDVAVLDVNLPGTDGFQLCRQIRASNRAQPGVIFLTARDAIQDRVTGLDLGAEDYVVKPFAFAELLARVRALLRRTNPSTVPVLRIADLELDPASRSASRAGQYIRLTAKEFALLEYLIRNTSRVVTKTMIADHVWNFDLEAESNFIEVLVYALRKKVDAPFGQPLIHTIRGAGYRAYAQSPS